MKKEALFFLTLIGYILFVNSQSCTITTSTFVSYNFTLLRNTNTNYRVEHIVNPDYHVYLLNVCGTLVPQTLSPNPSGQSCNFSHYGCQFDTTYADQFPKSTGSQSSLGVVDGKLKLIFTNGDFCPGKNTTRSTEVTFICNSTNSNPVFVTEDTCRYYFEWKTKYACPTYCAANPCLNGGACQEIIGNLTANFTCSCQPGWTGKTCEININDCASNPCMNGNCVDLVNNYTCSCGNSGFQGRNCEIDIVDCQLNSCLNGGKCVDGVNNFTCNCNGTGFQGDFCEQDVIDCQIGACLNGGICIEGTNSFTCNCNGTGFQGPYCAQDIIDCQIGSCLNGGICIEGNKGFTCNCTDTGYKGSLCEQDIDECASSPCANGKCINLKKKFSCDCNGTQYFGDLCEKVNYCGSNPCMNGGSCILSSNQFSCSCSPLYYGDLCEKEEETPQFLSVKPLVSPLLGTEISCSLKNAKDDFSLWIDTLQFSIPIEFRISSNENGVVSLTFTSPIYNQTGYVSLRAKNPSGRTGLVNDFFYSEDCPYENQWGLGLDCKACPKGTYCPGGYRLWPLQGFWNPDETTIPEECPAPSSRCLGGRESQCAPGYTGRLCSSCDSGYFAQGSQCFSCENHSTGEFIGRFLADIIFVLVLAFSFMFLRNEHVRKLVLCIVGLQTIRMGLQFAESFFSDNLVSVSSVLSILLGDSTNFVRPGCLIPGYTSVVPFWVALISVLIGQALILMLLPFKYYFVKVHSEKDATPQEKWLTFRNLFLFRWVRASIILLLFSYSNLTIRTFEVLICQNLFGELYVAAYPFQKCFHGVHIPAFVFALITLIVYIIGLPMLILFFVLKSFQNGQLETEKIRLCFGYIYDSFEPRSFYTGILWILVLFIQGLSFTVPSPITSLLLSIISYSFFGIFLIVRKPFLRVPMNYLSSVVIVFVVIVRIVAYVGATTVTYIVLFTLFFIACSMIVFFFICPPIITFTHNFFLTRKINKKVAKGQTMKNELSENSIYVTQFSDTGLQKKKFGRKDSAIELSLFVPSTTPRQSSLASVS